MTKELEVVSWSNGRSCRTAAFLAEELPFTIYLNDREIVTLLCTPCYLEELALGFLAGEGLVERPEEVTGLEIDDSKGLAWVRTSIHRSLAQQAMSHRFISSGCGAGTGFYALADARKCRPVSGTLQVVVNDLVELGHYLQRGSELYRKTHGVHSAALGAGSQVLILREDLGRHNAVDKIAGYCFKTGLPLNDKVLMVTGRISSEIVVKAVKMGIPFILSRSVPTSLAVSFGEDLGITLIGFARGKRFNVYTHWERIAGMG